MASVKLKLKTQSVNKSGEYGIVYEIIYKRKRKIINSGNRATLKQWDESTSNILTGPKKGLHPGGVKLKIALQNRLAEITEAAMLAELKKLPPDEFFAQLENQTKSLSFFEYFQKRIDELERAKKIGNARVYRLVLSQLKKSCNDLPIKQVDYNYLYQFKLARLALANSPNTIRLYLRTTRAVLSEAVRSGVLEVNPFDTNLMPPAKTTAKRALPYYNILTLEAASLKGTKAFARDVYLLGFYLRGMDFVDLAHLTAENIHGNRIVYNRIKSGQLLSIKINAKAMAILQRYANRHKTFLLPILDKPKDLNPDNYGTRYRRIKNNLQALGKDFCFDLNLTTKTNRHTWATVAKYRGVSRDVIAECLGHSVRGVTDIYLKEFDDSVLDDANDLVCGEQLCCL